MQCGFEQKTDSCEKKTERAQKKFRIRAEKNDSRPTKRNDRKNFLINFQYYCPIIKYLRLRNEKIL